MAFLGWVYSQMHYCRTLLVFLLVKSHTGSVELIADFWNVASGPLQLNCQCVTVNLGCSEVSTL